MKNIRINEVLSPLEMDVLKTLWHSKKLRVRQIFDVVRKKRKVALSSVAVICDRLYKRGIVQRAAEKARGGVRYVYKASENKSGFEKSFIDKVVNSLIDSFGTTATAYFHERFK
ncbi:BlaI/MecI/CopY family transcriptional regulator [Candidatus Woesearchaeota archaeon]|nr:BlaI/MecI/CopY family transcriptional regulator [Candidatus Woesearchaeota archaeon]